MALGALTYLAEGFGLTTTTATTGAFTPTAGATLLVGVAGRLAVDPTGLPAITDSLGTDLGWEEVEYGFYNIGSGFRTQLTVFRATVPASPVSMTVTGTVAGAAYVALIVTQITGANPNISNANNNKALTGNVTTAITAPAGTSTTVGFYAAIGASGVSPDAAYTEVRERVASTSLVIECAYDAGGDASASWTSANARCVLALFEVTEAGGESASGGGEQSTSVNLGGRGTSARSGGGILANAVSVGGGGTIPPPPPPTGAVGVTRLLMEDGFGLLMEDNSRLLLEVDDGPVYPDPGPQADNVHNANVRLGGRGGKVFIPVVPVPEVPWSGAAGFTHYEVSIEMTPTSRWIIRDARAVSIERSLNIWPGGLEAGTAEIIIDDASGIYWPAKSGITPNMGVRVMATFVDPGNSIVSSWHLFTGVIDAITTDPQMGDRTVQITCRDRWKLMQTRLITTTMMIDWPVGSILAHAFNQAAIDVSQRSIDAIGDVLPFAWARNITIAAMLDEFIAAGGYGAYVAPDGIVRIRDRYFEAGGNFSAVYTDTAGLTLSIDDAELINQVTAQGTPFMRVNSVQPIARISAAIGLAPSTFTLFTLGYQDPRNGSPIGATSCFQAVANSDYQLNTASDGTGTNLLSTMSATTIFYADRARVSIFNPNAFTVWATGFQVRGVPILAGDPISVVVMVDSSSVIHGVHDGAVTSDLFATHDLLERRAYDIVEQFAAPLLRADLQTIDDLPTALRLQLTDVVIVTNSHTGLISEQFTVHGINHELRADDTGIVHQMGLTLVRAREIDAFILDIDQLDIDRLSR